MENKAEKDYLAGEVLLIDKFLGWTSFDVVNKIRYLLKKHYGIKKIKVGHAGTLDPLASGLVILCTGKKTKEIESYQAQEKEYIAEITLGATTPSFDLETEKDFTFETSHITEKAIYNTVKSFIGKQEQMPPMFSAKKVDGKRAYISARKGQELNLKKSDIEIYDLEILEKQIPEKITLKIRCSKGTYIRALARDIGIALGSGAHLTKLRRTKIGSFSVDKAITVDEFEKLL